jgi:aspartyl-tRNA(Asn)/glutamyl-tRNA(Gln) amidotransferase subunit B
MNSFRFLERGVEAEIERQTELTRAGEAVVQETLHFDPRTRRLTSLRSKEEAHDYRYFPEPDLVPLLATPQMLATAAAAMPELPAARAQRLVDELELHPDRARDLAFRKELADYYEAALQSDPAHPVEPVELANWIPQLVERIGPDADPAATKVTPAALASLATMVAAKQVSRDAARDVLTRLVAEGGDPAAIVAREGLGALTAGDGDPDGLKAIVDAALAADPGAADKVAAGNQKALGPLVGFVMRETKGRADGGEVRRLILERLNG